MDPNESLRDAVIRIEGMTCMSCVRNIEGNIGGNDGVKLIAVSLEKKTADVRFDPRLTTAVVIAEAISDMGFDASLTNLVPLDYSSTLEWQKEVTSAIEICVEGMTCQSCVKHIEGMLADHAGIISARVSLIEKLAYVTFDPRVVGTNVIVDLIDDIGFEAKLRVLDSVPPNSGLERLSFSLSRIPDSSACDLLKSQTESVKGVGSVTLQVGIVNVLYDSAVTNRDVILAEVARQGYTVSVCTSAEENPARLDSTSHLAAGSKTCTISVLGMTCNSCVKHIEGKMSDVAGVISIAVSLEGATAAVSYDPRSISVSQIVEGIDDMGFEASEVIDSTSGIDASRSHCAPLNGKLFLIKI